MIAARWKQNDDYRRSSVITEQEIIRMKNFLGIFLSGQKSMSPMQNIRVLCVCVGGGGGGKEGDRGNSLFVCCCFFRQPSFSGFSCFGTLFQYRHIVSLRDCQSVFLFVCLSVSVSVCLSLF